LHGRKVLPVRWWLHKRDLFPRKPCSSSLYIPCFHSLEMISPYRSFLQIPIVHFKKLSSWTLLLTTPCLFLWRLPGPIHQKNGSRNDLSSLNSIAIKRNPLTMSGPFLRNNHFDQREYLFLQIRIVQNSTWTL
jgi:hypothetical protein